MIISHPVGFHQSELYFVNSVPVQSDYQTTVFLNANIKMCHYNCHVWKLKMCFHTELLLVWTWPLMKLNLTVCYQTESVDVIRKPSEEPAGKDLREPSQCIFLCLVMTPERTHLTVIHQLSRNDGSQSYRQFPYWAMPGRAEPVQLAEDTRERPSVFVTVFVRLHTCQIPARSIYW